MKEDDLQPVDQDRVKWCNTVLAEIEGLEHIDPASLPQKAPTVFEQLQSDAEEDSETIEAFLSSHTDGLTGFIAELMKWCHEQLEAARQRPSLLEMAETVKATRAVLQPEALEVLSRYQTTLDNQLIKSLRSLREAQEWRLKTLDAQCSPRSKHVDTAA